MYSTSIGNLYFENFIFNASGVWCTNNRQLSQLAETKHCGAVITKSCTLLPHIGNAYPKYHFTDSYSINSNGLENQGIDYYLYNQPYPPHKSIFISVGGHSNDERCDILKKIMASKEHPGGIELNMSCPNLGDIGPAYDPQTLERSLEYIYQQCGEIKNTLGLKLPPYYFQEQFLAIADVIDKAKLRIDFITCVNSVPNAIDFDIDNDIPVISPNGGYGGLGGNILPIGLANVKSFVDIFRKRGLNIDVIGCGGVQSGEDVYKYILAGAKAVQVGTHLWVGGPSVFEELTKEFALIMSRKGHTALHNVVVKN